jgi:hypothetical protein
MSHEPSRATQSCQDAANQRDYCSSSALHLQFRSAVPLLQVVVTSRGSSEQGGQPSISLIDPFQAVVPLEKLKPDLVYRNETESIIEFPDKGAIFQNFQAHLSYILHIMH